MIKLPAYFMGFRSKQDGSSSLTFASQEVTGQDFAMMKEHQSAFGWLVFKPQEAGELTDADMPSEKVEEEGKSPSKRLYDRMFVYFTKKKIGGDFDTWRKKQLEIIGQRYLNLLDEN